MFGVTPGPPAVSRYCVARARARASPSTRRMLVAALRGIERIEAVTEDARRVVRDERVLAPPARTVHGVVRVEIDEAAEAVGRGAEARRAEAVDRLAVIREAAEDRLEAAAVDPVRAGLELREVAGPVRDLEPLRGEPRCPRREAEIGERLRPALRGPVGAVGRLAGGDEVRRAPGRRSARRSSRSVFQ